MVAGAGANVREVSHLRHGQALAVGQVQVALAVETHGDEHFAAVELFHAGGGLTLRDDRDSMNDRGDRKPPQAVHVQDAPVLQPCECLLVDDPTSAVLPGLLP